MRPRRTISRSIGNDSSLWGGELVPEHALDDRRVVNAVDERRVDDWVIVTPEGDIQALELGRLRRAEDRRISPDERGGVRPDDVSDARREETARYDYERESLLRSQASVRKHVHVEPVRNMHDVDCDARRIPELEQHADGHVLIRRRDCRDRDIVVADVSGICIRASLAATYRSTKSTHATAPTTARTARNIAAAFANHVIPVAPRQAWPQPREARPRTIRLLRRNGIPRNALGRSPATRASSPCRSPARTGSVDGTCIRSEGRSGWAALPGSSHGRAGISDPAPGRM